MPTRFRSMKVFVADSDVQGLRKLGRELNTDPHDQNVYTTEVDVAEWESIERAFRYAVSALGRVDYVMPIAGKPTSSSIIETSDAVRTGWLTWCRYRRKAKLPKQSQIRRFREAGSKCD
jgi:NADP-dependent 3-hydroxy acid dehydrogenase YdfG